MKIAQIVCSFPPYKGGIGNVAYRLQKELEKEITIETFTIKQEKQKKENQEKNIHYLKPVLKIGQAGVLNQLIFKLKKFDVIILHYPFFGSTEILYLKRLLSKKQRLIILYHMDVSAFSGLYKILSIPGKIAGKKLLKQADKIVVSSLDYIKNSRIKDIYKQYPNKFLAIPFSVNEKKFKANKELNNNFDKNEIKLLFVGGLDKAHYFKGVDKLISALTMVKNKNWSLNIVGSGSLLNNFKEISKKKSLADKINFLGKISNEELIKEYQKADLLILPSINSNEAFGLVVIEAMACQSAIIASDLPGLRSVFNDKCGYKVKPGDVKDLTVKIEKALNNPEKIIEMKKESYKLFTEKYILEKEINAWLKLLKN